MFRNMVDSLVQYEQIETTLPKAKELRKYVDRVITLGKKGTLHARRRAVTLMRRREMVAKVFDELATRYQSRPGGYTRILHLDPRRGDSAPMAIIELVDRVVGAGQDLTKKGRKKISSDAESKAESKTESKAKGKVDRKDAKAKSKKAKGKGASISEDKGKRKGKTGGTGPDVEGIDHIPSDIQEGAAEIVAGETPQVMEATGAKEKADSKKSKKSKKKTKKKTKKK